MYLFFIPIPYHIWCLRNGNETAEKDEVDKIRNE